MPTQFPSSSLNFEQGEVVYENTKVLEWIRLFQLGNITALAYFGVFLPLNLAFKTNLTLEKADELFIGQHHLWNANSIDVLRLFTPISTLGVFYIIMATMKLITQVGGQYALKVSYSKDKVFKALFRNFSLLRESTISEWLRKMSMKQLISKFSLLVNEVEFRILALKMLMVFGVLLASTLNATFSFITMMPTGIVSLKGPSFKVYLTFYLVP